jgi:hypothetical protein
MNKNIWRLAAGGAVTAGLLAIPAGALATPTLAAPLAACYEAPAPHPIASIGVSLTGGGPGDTFQFSFGKNTPGDGSYGFASGTFDASGNSTVSVTNVFPPTVDAPTAGNKIYAWTTEISAADGTNTVTALGSTLVTNRAIDLGPAFVDGSKPRFVTSSGLALANQKVYGFIVHRSKVVRRIYLGKGNVCGYTRAKLVLIPKNSAQGAYIFYANAGPKLNKKTAISKSYSVERF